MKTTRRTLLAAGLAGAFAAPAAARMSDFQWKHGHGTVLLFDPDLAQGRDFAEAGRACSRSVVAIEGDRIRFARKVFAGRPAMVQGMTRQADAVLIEEIAGEEGYERVALEVSGDALRWTLMPRIRARG